jgi:hypothetical protein
MRRANGTKSAGYRSSRNHIRKEKTMSFKVPPDQPFALLSAKYSQFAIKAGTGAGSGLTLAKLNVADPAQLFVVRPSISNGTRIGFAFVSLLQDKSLPGQWNAVNYTGLFQNLVVQPYVRESMAENTWTIVDAPDGNGQIGIRISYASKPNESWNANPGAPITTWNDTFNNSVWFPQFAGIRELEELAAAVG